MNKNKFSNKPTVSIRYRLPAVLSTQNNDKCNYSNGRPFQPLCSNCIYKNNHLAAKC